MDCPLKVSRGVLLCQQSTELVETDLIEAFVGVEKGEPSRSTQCWEGSVLTWNAGLVDFRFRVHFAQVKKESTFPFLHNHYDGKIRCR